MSPYVRRRAPIFSSPAVWLLGWGLVLAMALILGVTFVMPARGLLAGVP